LKADLADYGSDDDAAEALSRLAFQMPLIGAMATRNFEDIAGLRRQGRRLGTTAAESQAAVQRALDKRAPFHRTKGSVADALLIECYASAIRDVDLADEPHGSITSNSHDLSATSRVHRRTTYARMDRGRRGRPALRRRAAYGYLIVSWAAGRFVDPASGPGRPTTAWTTCGSWRPSSRGGVPVTRTAKQSSPRGGADHGEVRWDALGVNTERTPWPRTTC
jgi:hypothetical protein